MPGLPVPERTPEPRNGYGARRRAATKTGQRGEVLLCRDAVFELWRENTCHIVSESYFYKTTPYYTILRHELEGRPVQPSSRAVLDAGVIPVCLELAGRAGIPVCPWGISQGYTPVPAILYGLHYFPSASEYHVVTDTMEAKEAIRHITNMGKYPFCYQPLAPDATVCTCTAVFGRTPSGPAGSDEIARAVYELYRIPLVTLVLVQDSGGCRLSSIAAASRYSHLSPGERSLLCAYLSHQEFL
jgi:hypothetical protein